MQLNLRKDENIIDFSYQISTDGQYHCIWILDEKLQIWKCSSEHDANQTNWTMVKVISFNDLQFKKFFKPAMTYTDYYMTSFIDDMKCIKNHYTKDYAGRQATGYMDFQFAFNGSATKCIIV